MTQKGNHEGEIPRREPGQWIDASQQDITYVGCDVCGWEDRGPYDEVRRKWVDHKHDPLDDIRHRHLRIGAAEGMDYMIDVGYLLDLIDRN